MRTQMHQDAFPGEDISDRPPPEAACRRSSPSIDGDRAERPLPRRRRPPRRSVAMTTLGHRSTVRPRPLRAPAELEATEPPELTLGRRDAVRMMVSIGDDGRRVRARLATWRRGCDAGDLVVVNTSATIPAAVDATTPGGRGRRRPPVHRAADRAAPRRGPPPTARRLDRARTRATTPASGCALAGGGTVRVLGRMPGSVRLWVATLDLPTPLLEHLQPLRPPDPLRATCPTRGRSTAYTNSFSRRARARPRCRRPGGR